MPSRAARLSGKWCLGAALTVGVVLGGQSSARADTTLGVPLLGQLNGAWAGAGLGTSPTDTVGAYGCAITAVAMVLNYYGVPTDPGALNAWLTANGGYASDDLLIWSQVTAASGGRVQFTSWSGADLDLVRRELAAGRPVIAEVSLNGGQHFVVLTGTTPAGFSINDPWFGDSVNFSERYGDPSTGILSVRTFAPLLPVDVRATGRPASPASSAPAGSLAQ